MIHNWIIIINDNPAIRFTGTLEEAQLESTRLWRIDESSKVELHREVVRYEWSSTWYPSDSCRA